ncbi:MULTISPECIES: hypothetical protein [Nocardia]|uniref:hypothetical protein n=1 Tax=Nocardia TaxID=1817 RepID=UPI000D68557C|nr:MULTISPECIES: hypothetical protein [Nocardia]
MGLGDFGEFLGHVGTLGIFKVVDNHDRSDNAYNDRGRNEWTRLDGNSEVSMAKPAVTDPEAFNTWSHEQIWNPLNGGNGQPEVKPGDVNIYVFMTPGAPPAIGTSTILRGRHHGPKSAGYSRTIHYEISGAGRIDYQYCNNTTEGTHGDPHHVVKILTIDLGSH